MSAFLESIARGREAVGARRVSAVPSPSLAARLESMHHDGLATLDEQGLPTRRDERWKGTKVATLEALSFDRIGATEASDTARANDDRVAAFAPDLLFVDGRMVQASAARADLPEGVRVLSLAEAATEIPDVVEARLGAGELQGDPPHVRARLVGSRLRTTEGHGALPPHQAKELTGHSPEANAMIIAGTARSMGIEVV